MEHEEATVYQTIVPGWLFGKSEHPIAFQLQGTEAGGRLDRGDRRLSPVRPVEPDQGGNVDLADLKAKAGAAGERLSCLMITYPSTHGVYEEGIREICDVVHQHGGQVYMDGANINAQVGLARPLG